MTAERTLTRSVEIFRSEGFSSLAHSTKEYLFSSLEDHYLKYRYKLEHGELAPKPDERLWVDPRNIEYTIYSGHLYVEGRSYPKFGILGGSWDTDKKHWRDNPVWDGLRARFEENKAWEETGYYQHAREKFENSEPVPYLDGSQTLENFENYLESLDELYKNIEESGYDPTSVITVHLGRNGEWITGHGNHRRTIATVIGIDSVPVRVKFRHKKWQDRRQRFYEADSIDDIPDAEEFLSHPDIPDIHSE